MKQKTLFDLDDVADEVDKVVEKTKSKATRTEEKIQMKLSKAADRLEDVIGAVEMGKTTHYVSISEWSMHDVLFHILRQTGPAEVCIATWSVSEIAVRQIFKQMEEGQITRLYALLDWRVKVRRPEVHDLLKFNISDIHVTTCHAKTTVIRNKKWAISIVGSANFTNNPRIEAGVISCDRAAADFHRRWILDAIKGANPFEVKTGRRNWK